MSEPHYEYYWKDGEAVRVPHMDGMTLQGRGAWVEGLYSYEQNSISPSLMWGMWIGTSGKLQWKRMTRQDMPKEFVLQLLIMGAFDDH